MLCASENLFWMTVNLLEIEIPPDIDLEAEMDNWLSSTITDTGGTVEQFLDFMLKGKEE